MPRKRPQRSSSNLRVRAAIFVVQALVISTFSLFGARDPRGVLELWGASAASAGGAAVAAVGSFAVLGGSSSRRRGRTTTRSWSATSPNGPRNRSAPIH